MKKHKGFHEEEDDEGGSERWLLTYADMITLLLALFIILYAMSSIELEKFEAMAQGFSSAFHADEQNAGGSGNSDSDSNENNENPSNGESGGTGTEINPLDEVYKIMSEYIDQNHLESYISLINTDSYVTIRLKGKLMFVPDSPELLESSKPIIKEISEVLKKVYGKIDRVTISGNTANIGEYNEQTDTFSWYLSVNRADKVRNILAEYGLPENKTSIEGYGHYKPIASNDTEEGRAMNRRAEITVYKYPTGYVDPSNLNKIQNN